MATFRIHQDIEKENTTFPVKDKTGKANVLQPIAGGIIGPKDSKQRFTSVLSNVNITRGTGGSAGSGIQKTAFREIKNVLRNDENAGISCSQQVKKSSAAPLDQFKTFSVYEDKTSTCRSTENNENQNPKLAAVAEEKIHEYFADENRNTYNSDILDTTPMSVTDVMSPMSIDRSQLSMNASLPPDNDSQKKTIKTTPLPRNDRERFYEVVEYQNCILQYFRTSEKKHRPRPAYMRRQPDINYSMRTILVDWLVEVAEEYNLDTETLYLAVSYIDRFLSHMSVVRAKLQLVGTAAMYIASKYEEIYPPDVSEFVFITDDTYTKAQVLRMEQIILKILSFDLCVPTSYVFINTYAALLDISDRVKYLCQYLSELSLLEGDPFLGFYPSMISSAALALAQYTLDLPIWSSQIEDVTSYRIEDLKEVFLCLSKIHTNATNLQQQAVQEKYKSSKYQEVSTIKSVNIDDELFDSIVKDYYQMKELTLDNSLSSSTVEQIGSTSSENVRKMISSLMYV